MNLKRIMKVTPRCFGKRSILKRKGFLFLFSHMRGYTSLMSHIIGSHPDVSGYAEMNKKIINSLDLLDLSVKVEDSGGGECYNKYVFDKVLHNNFIMSNRVINRSDVKIMFMIREPRKTIESIIRMKIKGYLDIDSAIHYYINRLRYLRDLSSKARGKCILIHAESIINCTDKALLELTSLLDLPLPLTSSFDLFKHSGKRGFGDSSNNILSQRVLKPQERDNDPIHVPDEKLINAYSEYNVTMNYISDNSNAIIKC